MRFEELDEEEKAAVVADEAIWRRAHEIVARRPHLDVSGVHHALVGLQQTPEERLMESFAMADAYAAAVRR